ncbi:MAG: hypothetical protein ACK5JR_01850 [Tropicimonas sp.]|uniref:hypothetical protein n=1 Tax=Tropicimonas sp. TaxID=2067044 RepID=UPI003A8A2616
MKTALTAAALTISASLAQAESVRVYSGEHADFSRIVLVFGESIGWSAAKSPTGFEVRFDRRDISMDLGGIFEKMPKDRVRNASYDPATGILDLVSDCMCEIELFEAGQRTVAIDIRTAAPAMDPGDSVGITTAGTVPFPFGVAGLSMPAPRFPLFPLPEEQSTGPIPDLSPRLAALETALLEQLERAVSQGVAEIAPGAVVPDPVAKIDLPALPENHIRSRTVYEVDLPDEEPGPACFGEDLLDVSSWASSEDPATALAMARNGLVSELDEPAPEKALDLVRTYLVFGFGAEAAAVISELGQEIENRSLYRAMAKVVDNEKLPAGSELLALTACDGPSALWALAAHEPDSVPRKINLRAVQAWFLRLPAPLRQQLGPRIVENLRAAGQDGAATTIRNAVVRASEARPPRLRLIDAGADLDGGRSKAALADLAELASDASELAPEAMTKLLNGARRRGLLDHRTMITAEAVAFENRDTPGANVLLEEIVLAWSQTGEFDAAWDAWGRLEEASAPRSSPDEIFSAMILDMVRKGAAGRVLRLTHSPDLPDMLQALSRNAVLAVAEWLAGNGFADKAQEVLAALPSDDGLDIRKTRARIALVAGEPSLALSFVAAESDPDSLTLRAEALSALGDHAAASLLFETASRPEEAAREAWLGGEAGRIAEVGSEPERAFALQFENDPGAELPPETPGADRAEQPPGPAQQAPGEAVASLPTSAIPGTVAFPEPVTLRKSRELIEASRSSREVIAGLLEEGASQPSPVAP